MILQILINTPGWVWLLLVALVAIGLVQARSREMSVTRATVLPLALIGLALWGVLGAFGLHWTALAAWLAGAAAAITLGARAVAPRGATWSPTAQRLHVPGSWLPLALIVAIFSVRYAAGVTLALRPALAHDIGCAVACSLIYGISSGLFLARGLALRRLAAAARPGTPVAA